MAAKNEIKIIVETPRGSRNKYNYDPESGSFYLKKILPLGMVFPFDFGSIPGTEAEDGDPLDAVVLTDEPLFTGCTVECRIVGAIKATQTHKRKTIRNDRLIAVTQASLLYKNVKEFTDIDVQLREQLEGFFVAYNKQEDKVFKPIGRVGSKEAMKLLERAKKT